MDRTTKTARTSGRHTPKRVLLIDSKTLEPILPGNMGEDGLPTREEILASVNGDDRNRSIRAYRATIDRVVRWVMLGKISPKDGKAMADILRTGAEMLMAERLLAAQGIEDVEGQHILGPDGGADVPTDFIPHQEITVRREKGIGPDGNEVDKTVVERKGGPDIVPGGLDALEPPL